MSSNKVYSTNRHLFFDALEDEEDIARADAVMTRVVEGKEKLYSEKDVLKRLK